MLIIRNLSALEEDIILIQDAVNITNYSLLVFVLFGRIVFRFGPSFLTRDKLVLSVLLR